MSSCQPSIYLNWEVVSRKFKRSGYNLYDVNVLLYLKKCSCNYILFSIMM
jgi:hypothetical protein